MAVVELDNASKVFSGRRGWLGGERQRAVRAVNAVSFKVERGERLGIVGESGSGKTTTARMILGLTEVSSGRVVLADRDVTALRDEDRAHIRRTVQMVFQDPLSSLNPKKTVRQIISLPLVAQRIGTPRQRLVRVNELLDQVGLPKRYLNARPEQLSGGQRQRVGLARALAIEPALLVLDEPTASLDVSVQARVLELLLELQRDLGIAQIMVSHNLGVIRNAADKVAVMYLGRIIEFGTAEQIFSAPRHPYTQALFSAIPVIDESERAFLPERRELRGEITSATQIPSGCPFHTRCPAALPHCATVDPATTQLETGHLVDCHLHAATPASPSAS